jgi:hypothetical protein
MHKQLSPASDTYHKLDVRLLGKVDEGIAKRVVLDAGEVVSYTGSYFSERLSAQFQR